MAHESTLVGGISESIATALFMSRGMSVFVAAVPEVYDLIVIGDTEDGSKEMFRVQVKTIKIRNDREGQIVVRGANQSGTPYSKKDVDYIFGVYKNVGYLIPNREIGEYWARDFETAAEKWTEFRLDGDY